MGASTAKPVMGSINGAQERAMFFQSAFEKFKLTGYCQLLATGICKSSDSHAELKLLLCMIGRGDLTWPRPTRDRTSPTHHAFAILRFITILDGETMSRQIALRCVREGLFEGDTK